MKNKKESVFDSLIDIPKPKEDLPNIFLPDPTHYPPMPPVKPPKKEKKKAVNSKAKGKGFEGEIAKQLSTAFAPYQFKRVLHSGAILGGKNVKELTKYSELLANLFIGDVVCINDSDKVETFRFNVECKFYKTPETLDNFLGETNSNLPKWYEESVIDAQKVNKDPLLIVKYNRSSVYCITGDDQYVDDLPTTITGYVHLQKFGLKVFLFKEALQDQPWWFNLTKDNT